MHSVCTLPRVLVVLLGLLSGVCTLRLAAQPANFADQLYFGGWNQAIGITFDANGVMYVWEKGGKVWAVKDSVKSAAPLVDISEEVGNFGDHGMVGFALDPNYTSNGYIYLLYVVDRHYLLNYGTPGYNPALNEYNNATIGRVTRYTVANPGDATIAAAQPASRLVLVGETKETGMPIVHNSHGVGSLVFGTDGTLLVSIGDGASYNAVDNGGPDGGSYAIQALADNIIRPAEDVGAFRSQMLTSHNGKVLRIDPNTGNGISSNPFYDGANPRSSRSRTWALGLRNPSRMTLRPGTGSHNPADANPGVLYIGDVGWYTYEELDVCTGPGMNFGWPIFEGPDQRADYTGACPYFQDQATPTGCAQPYYLFTDLIKQWNGGAAPAFPNPCTPGQQINGAVYDLFAHSKPAVSWRNGAVRASRDGVEYTVGGATVPGPTFNGNCSMGGVWYTGTDFPAEYQNTYFQADYGNGWIRRFAFDANDKIEEVFDFAAGLGGNSVVAQATHPTKGGIYYISYNTGAAQVRKYYYGGNRPPVAVATQSAAYSAANSLMVNFTGSGSSDPEGETLTYLWNFGDGTTSNATNPAHTFTAPGSSPVSYTITLTVTDPEGAVNTTTLYFSLNNTPPVIVSTSLDPVVTYSMSGTTTLPLSAVVTDTEHNAGQLTYAWQTVLYHDTHNHPEAIDNNPVTSTTIDPLGCDDHAVYWYGVTLIVTDAAGLRDTFYKEIFADCQPIAHDDAASYLPNGAVSVKVLDNDEKFNKADTTTLAVVTAPLYGTAIVNPLTGAITYTHTGGGSGSDSFTYTFDDKLGNNAGTATVTLTQVAPPSVTITSPAPNATIPGSALAISYTLGGTTSVIGSVSLSLDGAPAVTDAGMDGNYTFEGVAPGAHQVVIQLLDANGAAFAYAQSQATLSVTHTSLASVFSYFKYLTIESDYVYGATPHTHFPVLVSITDPDLRTVANGGAVQHPNGYDIFFTSYTGVELYHQTERYNPATGELIAWVNIPSLPTTTDTDIRMYFGSASITSPLSSTATWNTQYQGRWHMDHQPGSGQLQDGTANNRDGVAEASMTAANRVAGKIGYGTTFDGVDDYYAINTPAGNTFTLSAWINSNQVDANWHGFLGGEPGATAFRAPSMWVYQNTAIHFGFGNGINWNGPTTPVGVITANTWQYVTTSFNGTSYTCYVNGNAVYTTNAYAGQVQSGTPLSSIGKVDNQFKGILDEVHVSNTARSADWIQTEYYNQAFPNDFIRVGTTPVPPVITLTAPTANQTLFGTIANTAWTVSGNLTTADEVQLILNGGTPVSYPVLNGTHTFTGLSSGAYQLIARILDPSNAIVAADTVSFTLQPLTQGFADGRVITLHHEEIIGTTPHQDFPVSFTLTLPQLRHVSYGGTVEHLSGYDIVFTDANDNLLMHQVESYTPSTGTLVVWVKIPSLPTDVDSYVKMLFGNPAFTADPNTTDTWNTGYEGRWHMNNAPDATAPQLQDATSNNFDGTANGGLGAANRVTGKIGQAICFDGVDDYFNIGNVLAGQTFTEAAWIQSNQVDAGFHGFIGNQPTGVLDRAPSLWVYNNGYVHGGFGEGVNWGNSNWLTPAAVVTENTGTWHYVVATYEALTYRVYVDGNLVHTKVNSPGNPSLNTPVSWIGRMDNYFKGCIDEVSISTVARSADWIATEYRNIQNTGPFYSISDISSFPVEWLGLEAVRTAHAVQLQWITATETGSDYFTVERSADGRLFTDLSRTDAAGYSESPRTYTATDAAPLAGTTWYRIRETDLDGTTSWSSIVEVGPAGFLSAVSVYPNPAVDRLTVQWPAQAGQTKPVVATLYNSLGAQVPLTILAASATRLDVAVGHLAEGLYFLDLQQAGSSYRIPVVIRP